MTCEHDLAERETACADGMCPICAAARAEAAQIEVAHLREQVNLLTRILQLEFARHRQPEIRGKA